MRWSSTIVQNAGALLSLQAFRKVIPLIMIPYLARTLGVAVWGKVAFAMSVSNLLALLVEFGFQLSATRSVARSRDSKAECSEVVAGVIGVQAALFLVGALAATLVRPWLPYLGSEADLFAAALVYAAAQGFMPLWFFQGVEQIRSAVVLEMIGRVIALGCLFLFVHSPADGVLAILMQAFAPGVITVVGLWLMYSKVPFRLPSRVSVSAALQSGLRMFVFRGGKALYGPANVLLLGLFAPLQSVSYFAAAERIYTAAFGLLTPLQDALYPRISMLLQKSVEPAARLASRGAIAVLSWALILVIILLTMAGPIVRAVMGPGFEEAVIPLRILAFALPAAAVMVSTGMQWLVPLGMDGAVNRAVIFAGVLNIILALILAPTLAHTGMALSVTIAETAVAVSMVAVTLRTTPFWRVRMHHAPDTLTSGSTGL